MALTDDNGVNATELASPTGGINNGGFGGFGGDSWGWLILLLLIANGGWGNGFGGFGGGIGSEIYPWMNQANLTSNGFQNQMLNDNVTSIRDGIANLSTQLCGCCGDMQMALANGFAGVEQGANARQIANMQTAFAGQTAMAQGFNNVQSQLAECCCENRLGIANLGSTIISENCADRTQAMQNTRDIIDSQTRSTQAVLDKLCQLELDGFKRENDNLRTQLNMASLRESQTAQNAFISQGFSNEVDALYNRLSSCPVGTVPVAGNTPLFSCNPSFNGNNGCGCGCGNF